jgi:uroporphyrinogen decarboxylase
MMTSRQRFYETLRYGNPDRVPYFEEGIREDVLKNWRKQGLIHDVDLLNLFTSDHFEEIQPDLDPRPYFKKWPNCSAELELIKQRLNPNDPARLPNKWKKKVRLWNKKDQVLFLRVHRGFFLTLGVSDWGRFNQVISLLLQNPEFVREAMLIQGEFAANFFEKVLNDIEIDAAIFSEPIGGNEGPLISPKMYEEFVLKSYKPLITVLKKYGVKNIVFRTYANARILIPCILKYGFNCLWACETNIEAMDYLNLRKEFGSVLGLIGGIDLDVLRYNKEIIRREIESKVLPLLEKGGYIPLLDGRVRKDIPLENYLYYRHLLEKITTN